MTTWRVGELGLGNTVMDGTAYGSSRWASIQYGDGGYETIILSTYDIPSGYRFHHWVIEFFRGDKAPSFVSPCYSETYTISNPKDASISGRLKATLYLTRGSGPTPGDTYLEVTTYPSPAAGGTTSGDGEYWGKAGSKVSVPLRATPAANWIFVRWQGSTGWTSTSRNVNLSVTLVEDGDIRWYTAYFRKKYYTIIGVASPENGGTVSPAKKEVDFDQTATLTATPKPDYTFDHWSNGATTPTISFTPTSNVTLTAYFTWNGTYTVTTRPNDPEMGSTSPSSQTVNPGESVHITATPNEHYRFVNWSDGDTNADRTVIPEGPLDLVANFESLVYKVTASVNDNRAPISPVIQYVPKGDPCDTISVGHVPEWHPYGWYVNGVLDERHLYEYSYSFVPSKDTAVSVKCWPCGGIETICPAILNPDTFAITICGVNNLGPHPGVGLSVINFPGVSWLLRIRYHSVFFDIVPKVNWLRIKRFREMLVREYSAEWSEWMDWNGPYTTPVLLMVEPGSVPKMIYKIEFDVEILPGSGLILYGADGNILHGTNDRIVYADQLT